MRLPPGPRLEGQFYLRLYRGLFVFTFFEKEAYSGKRFSIHERHKVLKKTTYF